MDKILCSLVAKLQMSLDEYKKLKTDQDRIIFTLNVLKKYNIVPKTTGMPKDAQNSNALRDKGNKIFVQSGHDNMKYIEALKIYTESIAFAPYPSRELALAYANRSAILFMLHLFSETIQDIDRALALDYPDDLRAKLFLRKTHALILLKNKSVEDIIKETEYWLEKMSLKQEQLKLRAKLDMLRLEALQAESNTEKLVNKIVLPNITSYNNEILCASDAVVIKYNNHYGRHVVATRDIRPGEVIAIEKPYSWMLMKDNKLTHCSNCLKVCWVNIPCNYCTCTMYCSEKCRDSEWEKCHDIECTVFPALMECNFLTTDMFSMRLVVLAVKEAGGIKQLRDMLNETEKHDDPRTVGFSEDGKLHSDKYISLYNLVRNSEERTVHDLFRRSLDATFILYFLATRTAMFDAKLSEDLSILAKNDDVTFIGGLILRHQQIIPNNAHSVRHWLSIFYEQRDLEDTVPRGMVAMPFCSLINHSCNPNITRYSTSEHLIVFAIYPIQKDEQILDNYGEHQATMPRLIRQQKLLEQYFFLCDCRACQEDWPLYHDLQSYKSLVTKKADKAKIKKALKKFSIYVELTMMGDVLDKPYIIEDLLMMIQVLYDYAPMPCEEMNNVVETLKRVYDLHGNRFITPKLSTY